MTRTFVTVVTGLPRSGTSLMMQALDAGGLPPLTDQVRAPDEDNPRGYYEFEPVKKTAEDPSWLARAPGKVVKMVYKLVYDLPAGYDYRLILMRRNVAEVLASQRKMLARLGQEGGKLSDERMAKLFETQLAQFETWLATREDMGHIAVDYARLIREPHGEFARVNEFLGGALDVSAMAAVVDPTLYRNRA
jgi:hypothetical protein